METSFYYGGSLLGGVVGFPNYTYRNRPVSSSTLVEQINAATSIATIIPVIGNVVGSVTGVYANGISTTQPGGLGGSTINQQNPQEAQVGFTGTVGG